MLRSLVGSEMCIRDSDDGDDDDDDDDDDDNDDDDDDDNENLATAALGHRKSQGRKVLLGC